MTRNKQSLGITTIKSRLKSPEAEAWRDSQKKIDEIRASRLIEALDADGKINVGKLPEPVQAKLVHAATISDAFNKTHSLKKLVKGGINVNVRDEDGYTEGHNAVVLSHPEVLKVWLAAGGDVNAGDRDNYTMLHIASSGGKLEMLDILLKADAKPDAIDSSGNTAVHSALKTGNQHIIQTLDRLKKAKADFNIRNTDDGNTPLHEAVVFRGGGTLSEAIVEKLLECGADKTITNNDGLTPEKLAKNERRHGVAELIRRHNGVGTAASRA